MKRKIGITLVTLGLILILFAVALFLYNNFENKKAQEQSDDSGYYSVTNNDIEISVGGVAYGSSATSTSEQRFKIKIDTAAPTKLNNKVLVS